MLRLLLYFMVYRRKDGGNSPGTETAQYIGGHVAPRQEPSRLLSSDLQALYANGALRHPGRRTFFLQQLLSCYLEQRTFGKVKDNDLLVLIAKTEPSFNRTAPFLAILSICL